MKITIELDQDDLMEIVQIINQMQMDVESMSQRLEEMQSVIEGYQG
jgi:hypothetical protein